MLRLMGYRASGRLHAWRRVRLSPAGLCTSARATVRVLPEVRPRRVILCPAWRFTLGLPWKRLPEVARHGGRRSEHE